MPVTSKSPSLYRKTRNVQAGVAEREFETATVRYQLGNTQSRRRVTDPTRTINWLKPER
jgi:hypothetical protein